MYCFIDEFYCYNVSLLANGLRVRNFIQVVKKVNFITCHKYRIYLTLHLL